MQFIYFFIQILTQSINHHLCIQDHPPSLHAQLHFIVNSHPHLFYPILILILFLTPILFLFPILFPTPILITPYFLIFLYPYFLLFLLLLQSTINHLPIFSPTIQIDFFPTPIFLPLHYYHYYLYHYSLYHYYYYFSPNLLTY